MTKLPALKPKELIKAIQRAGFQLDHQTGSHMTFLNNQTNKRVTISFHAKDLKKGTLHSIIKQTGLSAEEFVRLL